jgi:MoxR-like ATPase
MSVKGKRLLKFHSLRIFIPGLESQNIPLFRSDGKRNSYYLVESLPSKDIMFREGLFLLSKNILAETDFSEANSLIREIKKQINTVIIGKNEVVELALTAFFAQGHLLVEDLPGTGKTTLSKTIARTLGCDFKRIQFTPDLMPSDITGMNYYNTKTGEFEFRPGPVLTNVLLADEINRTTPRTQSALLEVMEEKQVTVDGVTRWLEKPFLVLATQNPIDMEGTFPLPYAQLDRFLLKIKLGYPSREDEKVILEKHVFGNILESIEPVLDRRQAQELQEIAQYVFLADSLHQYILDIVEATRNEEAVELALSPRATISMVRAAKALALLKERDYVIPDDIRLLCVPVFAHRLKLRKLESYKGQQVEVYLQQLLEKIPLPLEERR